MSLTDDQKERLKELQREMRESRATVKVDSIRMDTVESIVEFQRGQGHSAELYRGTRFKG